MTERAAPRPRASRRELRAWAWVAGGLALVTPWAAVDAPVASASHERRPVLVLRKVTRRVIVTHPAQPAGVRYVYVNGPSSSGSGSGGSGSGGSGSGGSSGGSSAGSGGSSPPTTSTGGS
jgi:uncharacterized membrane protein YgcG